MPFGWLRGAGTGAPSTISGGTGGQDGTGRGVTGRDGADRPRARFDAGCSNKPEPAPGSGPAAAPPLALPGDLIKTLPPPAPLPNPASVAVGPGPRGSGRAGSGTRLLVPSRYQKDQCVAPPGRFWGRQASPKAGKPSRAAGSDPIVNQPQATGQQAAFWQIRCLQEKCFSGAKPTPPCPVSGSAAIRK